MDNVANIDNPISDKFSIVARLAKLNTKILIFARIFAIFIFFGWDYGASLS